MNETVFAIWPTLQYPPLFAIALKLLEKMIGLGSAGEEGDKYIIAWFIPLVGTLSFQSEPQITVLYVQWFILWALQFNHPRRFLREMP